MQETPVPNPVTVPDYIDQGYEIVPGALENSTRLTKTNDDNTIHTVEIDSNGDRDIDTTMLGDFTENEVPFSVLRDNIRGGLTLIQENGFPTEMSVEATRRYKAGVPLLDVLRFDEPNMSIEPVVRTEAVAPARSTAPPPPGPAAPSLTVKQSNGYRKLLLGVALTAVGIGSLIWWNRKTAEADRVAYEAAIAVSVLPPGVEHEWMQFVDQRLVDRIRVVGENLLVKKRVSNDRTDYISRNMPYSVDCGGLGSIRVTFGSRDSGISVEVARLEDNKRGSPALPVDPASIAGKKLRQALCAQVAKYIGLVANH